MSLVIEDYSEKSFAVYGSTVNNYSDDLLALGGTANSSLNRKSTGKKCNGFIFPNFKRNVVTEFIDGLEKYADTIKPVTRPATSVPSSRLTSKPVEPPKVNRSDPIWSMMLSRIENLESEVNILKQALKSGQVSTPVSASKLVGASESKTTVPSTPTLTAPSNGRLLSSSKPQIQPKVVNLSSDSDSDSDSEEVAKPTRLLRR